MSKITVIKEFPFGERVAVETNAKALDADLERLYYLIDRRLYDLNKRVLLANEAFKKVAKEHPDVATLVDTILRQVCGMTEAADTLMEAVKQEDDGASDPA